ncbi:choline transporter-like protein 1 [Gambusia affinis]|uniref:choline transporter-like protein 1 n=1 Tax=Gambusia affinis TaxID=33528 RepID=UPI001CDD10FC|nr:choline transporter-like protein 1 [Gambusia affinis]
MGCCSSTEGERDWNPTKNRRYTDIPWLLIFSLFCIGMALICGFAIATGGASRLVSGYDSYGNTCGRNNTNKKIDGVPLSGADMTAKKYVFFLEPCKFDVINRKIKSIALCVSKCPATELKTYKELKDFALSNGSNLCSYELTPTRYESSSERSSKCPKLPVPQSQAVPVFHRCIPVDIRCYAEFAQDFITFVSDNTVLRRVIAGVITSKEIIMGLCVLAFVLSLIMTVVIRYISKVLVIILTVLVIIGSVGGTGILWWLYADQKYALSNNSTSGLLKEVAWDNDKALLVYSIGATIFTVVLLLLMFFLRKHVSLTISLFHVTGKVFTSLPLLFLHPFWTFLGLMMFWVYWIAVLLFLGTSGSPVKNNSTGVVEYQMQGPLQYMVWYHLVGLIWISEFILAFQQMTIAGAVSTYFFTRDKNNLPQFTVVNSSINTLRYHMGTVAKGSFIITLVKIPRIILTYIHTQLKGKENACARCMLKACVCCLYCLEKCLAFLNQNAYTATAINSTNFCSSVCDAFKLLLENAAQVAVINTVGDFVLFMGKVLIVSCTAFAGILALNHQQDYTVWVLPLLISCLFAYLVANCFLSLFENVVDVLFLCYAVDKKLNDGSSGRPYYMDKELMEHIEKSSKMGKYKSPEGEGREMKPMRSGESSA